MNDTTPDSAIAKHLRDRLRSLEMEQAAIRARVEEVQDLLAKAERQPKKPRKAPEGQPVLTIPPLPRPLNSFDPTTEQAIE